MANNKTLGNRIKTLQTMLARRKIAVLEGGSDTLARELAEVPTETIANLMGELRNLLFFSLYRQAPTLATGDILNWVAAGYLSDRQVRVICLCHAGKEVTMEDLGVEITIARPRMVKSRERYEILKRDNWQCRYCGKNVRIRGAVIDHIVPYTQNGPTVAENLVTACKGCNNRKGSRTPEEAGMALLPLE